MSFKNDNCELAVHLRRSISLDASPRTQKLFARAFHALRRAGLTSMKEVVAAYPERLLRISGFGPESLRVVEMAFPLGAALLRGQENAFMASPLKVIVL